MTEIRHIASWLRGWLPSIGGLAAVAGALILTGCGGGSGAPNNVFKGPVTVEPTAAVAYSGMPSFLTITSGTGPFRAISSNSGVLPVTQNVAGKSVLLLANQVGADTDVTITIQDLGPLSPTPPTTTAVVTVRAAPLLNSFTIVPNLADCATSLCSGQTATAKVTVQGPQGGLLPGRSVRFDVIGSSYAIVTNNPAQPLTSSLTIVSDSTGTAAVIVKANVSAPSQVAQMSVTDLSSGQQLVGNFTIVQITDGAEILSVVPDTVTINGPIKGVCSTGFATDYYIYGGTPPYRITSTFPNSVTLANSTVNANGGFFRAITNGSCVDPLVFSILDATGRQVKTELRNLEGDEDTPPPTPISVSPTAQESAACTGNSFNLFPFGGTPPYNARPSAGVATPQTIAASGAPTIISGLKTGSGIATILFLDSGTPQLHVEATINCLSAPPPPALIVSAGYSLDAATCKSTSLSFTISGGVPSYSASFSTPPIGGGSIVPPTIANSGGGFVVTGLSDAQQLVTVVVTDAVGQLVTREIKCGFI